MSEKEICNLLMDWQICQHCEDEEGIKLAEEALLKVGINMEDSWEQVLKGRNLIQ